MALGAKSLFNYGIQVTTTNNALDFKAAVSGPVLTATLSLGFYSPTTLAAEVALQLQTADPANIYSVSVNRNYLGGTENRITISTNGSYLSLLFASGPNTFINCSSLIGFNSSDYTGNTTYVGSSSTGVSLIPDYIGYNYLDPQNQSKLFGAVNVSASGVKEAVVFNTQFFINVDFKYEAKARLTLWKSFFTWAIQQRPFDFTPEIVNPNTFYSVTLEKTQYHDQGLGYLMNEMLPDFPNYYETGALEFRVIPSTSAFA